MQLNDTVIITAPDNHLGRRARGFKGKEGTVKAVGVNRLTVVYPGGQWVNLPVEVFERVEK